ncbi:MAG: YHS domain-containing protein [Chloroflexi bacterium]|nr:YHS domain-containing protein [Chloroflexota bacterium]
MADTYKCPVCGMEVTPETAGGKSEYKGHTYYFCSKADKDTFDQNPEKYISQEQKTAG